MILVRTNHPYLRVGYHPLDASNASRGILTTWKSSNLKLLTSLSNPYVISTKFEFDSNRGDSVLEEGRRWW
jgi:hypothetical protein